MEGKGFDGPFRRDVQFLQVMGGRVAQRPVVHDHDDHLVLGTLPDQLVGDPRLARSGERRDADVLSVLDIVDDLLLLGRQLHGGCLGMLGNGR